MVIKYLLVGVIFYAIMCALRWHTFKNADLASIARGFIFGVFLWPAAMIFVAMDKYEEKTKK